jgi:integrase
VEETSGVTELAERIARALRVVPKPPGPRFVWLAADYMRHEGRRLGFPDVARRQLRHLRPLWSLREGELTPRKVGALLASLLKANGGALSPPTINKLRAVGLRVIRAAQRDGKWTSLNPFELTQREREDTPQHYVPTAEELRLALPRLRRDRHREALCNAILGPRPGELKALWKADVDPVRRTLTFRRSNQQNRTKTGKTRTVPVPDSLWPIIEEAMRASPSHLVFPKADGGGGQQRADTKLSKTIRTAYRLAGLVTGFSYKCRRKGCGYVEVTPEKKQRRCPRCNFKLWRWPVVPRVTWYALRHSAATLHRLAGCDPLVIQRCLGHAESVVTDRLYTGHLPLEYMRAELSKLNL